MKAYVNDDTCIGCGACPEVCPEIFHMTDEDIAHAIDGEIPSDLVSRAEDARDSCPVDAINLDE
ncbi:MAG: ferredoxin [Terrisporobacter sp.]|uniref:ferredoxin n=1 Tax=Terrisporobacter sp. TaxID=1965305 RepID=UPI002FC9DA11